MASTCEPSSSVVRAARNTLIKKNLWKNYEVIGMEDWSDDLKNLFKSEYKLIRDKAYWAVQKVVDSYSQGIIEVLDKIR